MDSSSDSSTSSSPEENSEEELQQARAFLREKFLRFVAAISNDQECKFELHENGSVVGKIKAADLDFENIAVEKLQTPLYLVENAILRASDIISMHLSNVSVESLIN